MTAEMIPSGLPTPLAEYRLARNGRATGDCPACGKERFFNRKTARKAAKEARLRSGGLHLGPYQCGDFWHYGRLGDAVIEGRMTRDGRPHPDLPLLGSPTVAAQIRAVWNATRATKNPDPEEPTRETLPAPTPYLLDPRRLQPE